MTVSLVLVIIMGVLFAAGVYAMLERSLTRVLIGFLLLGNAVWLISHYRRRFRADNAISSAFYFAGHFLIVRALYL